MKKTALILILVGSVCLAGCGAKQNKAKKSLETDNDVTTTMPADETQKEKDEANSMEVIAETEKAVEEVNQSSEMGGLLLEYFKGGERSFNPQAPNVFRIDGTTEQPSVHGYYYPYPYYSKDQYFEKDIRLTQISLYSELFHVFGIKVGDDIASIGTIMKDKGYALVEGDSSSAYYESEGKTALLYKKYDVHIQFITGVNGNKIEEIFIGVSNEDKDGIVYN